MPGKDTTGSNTNILPNNPMSAHHILDHLKVVKGDMGWYEFNLKCLTAAFPKDKTFADAYAVEQNKSKAATSKAEKAAAADTTKKAPAASAASTKASGSTKGTTKATKGPDKAASNKAKGGKKEPGDSVMPRTEDVKELANIA